MPAATRTRALWHHSKRHDTIKVHWGLRVQVQVPERFKRQAGRQAAKAQEVHACTAAFSRHSKATGSDKKSDKEQ